MNVIPHRIPGLLELQPQIYKDDRGWFFEAYNQQTMAGLGITDVFVQDNQSVSHKGVLRGMHYQRPPYHQVKLVRVAAGRGLDVVIDLRHDSPTYGQYASFLLDSERQNMVYVPAGLAHGFLSLEDHTILVYKCTNFYHRESEGGILWSDPDVNIDWGITDPLLSDKDRQLPLLRDFERVF